MPEWTLTGKATTSTVVDMFAPWCSTCGSRRLLPLSRIVTSDWHRGGTIRLRCDCGDLVDADARPPRPPDALARAS